MSHALSRCCRNKGAPWEKKWNTASAAVVEKYALVGSMASLLTNQLEDTNHHRSCESSADKLGDFCKCSRCSQLEGDCNVTTFK